MPDSKITALASTGTGTDPANDPLVIVDVSDTSMAATGTTKKVTLNQLLATSPTATLASATITGDILNRHLLERLVSEFEIHTIFHLAALLSTRSEFTPETAHEVNVTGTLPTGLP